MHPAFRNGARSVARLYDALHDPEHKDVLTIETDTGNGGFTHAFFRAPMSAQDLVRGRDAIAAWQRMTYRWMGRSPDYKTAFLATYGPNANYYTPFEENARRWYKESRAGVSSATGLLDAQGIRTILPWVCRSSSSAKASRTFSSG